MEWLKYTKQNNNKKNNKKTPHPEENRKKPLSRRKHHIGSGWKVAWWTLGADRYIHEAETRAGERWKVSNQLLPLLTWP